MTSEALNIKLQLDISDITAGVKKVKTQLSGMADKVKQSIPKINTESKRAKDSLSEVGKAGEKVKKSMTGIGDEAKKSLSGVVAQSNRVTQALNAMGIASRKSQSTTATDEMTESTGMATVALEELEGTMSGLLGINIAGFVTSISDKFSGMKDLVFGVKDSFVAFGGALKDSVKVFGDYGKTLSDFDIEFKKAMKTIGLDKAIGKDIKKAMRKQLMELDASVVGATKKMNASFDALKKSLKAVGQSILGLLKNFALFSAAVIALTGAIAALVATVNALKISKLGKELYTNAQQAGFSAQGYQEWAYVLEKAGVEAQELREIMKTLTESQVDVIDGNEDMIKAYAQLGMSVEEVKSMNQEELWSATIKALQNIENTTLRTSIAYKLFSEDTAKLTSVLNLSNEQTQQLISSYNQLGGAMSKELIHNSNVLQGALLNLRVAWEGLKNTLAQYVIPVIIVVVEWLTKAIVAVNTFLKSFFNIDTTPMTDDMSSGMSNVSGALGDVENSAGAATDAVEKLKRVTMGFDELNIVSDPNKKDSTDTGAGGSTDTGIADIGKFDTGKSIFLEASKQAEELKKKITDFVDKFKEEIAIIGTALATLGVAKLLEGLGNALGLGEKFLTTMQTIKKLASTAITIVLQYTLVNKFLDKYLDGEGFKNYLMGLLVAAIGTGVLYSMWGPTGLVIGLGVTAVAAMKAVLDHGGIKDVESLTVALTGLAAAIGAVYTAWTKLGLDKLLGSLKSGIVRVIGDIGAFIALVKEGNSVFAVFGAAFPKLAGFFTKIGTAIAGAAKAVVAFVGGLSAGAIAAIIAVVAALAAGVYSLCKNWEEVKKATKDWIDLNIKPILDDIKESWDKMKKAVSDVGKAISDAIPDSFKQKLKEIGQAIADVVKAIGEWFASIDWIKGIGTVIEWIGNIVVTILGGVVAGVIQGVIKLVEGLAQMFAGLVEIVAGVIEAIVKLFTGDFKGAWDACKKIVDGIVDLFVGLYDATIGVVVELVKGIINWCVELWDELVGHSIIPDMCEAIIEWFNKLYDNTIGVIVKWVKELIDKIKTMWNDIKTWFNSDVKEKFTKEYWNKKFDTIKQAASEKLNAAKKTITDTWNSVKTWFSSNVAPKFTLSYWQNKFETVRKAASDKLNAVKTTITGVWDTISGWFKNSVAPKFTVNFWTQKFSTIKDGARSAFNGIISVVEKAINSIINKINTLSWKIPDWVPVYGGDTFGFNFRTVSIPRLATGGVAVSDTLAHIGEGGYREAVLPLDRNTGWMDDLADKIAARNSAPTKIALVVDGKELGWATINNINAITKQTGGLQLAWS